MVISVAAITVVIGMGGVSLDIASWYQTQHQAQVAADAAALGAANCLADAGNSGNACTSTTDTTDANAVATAIASDNHVPISSVSYSAGYVTVTTATSAPLTFAGMFHVTKPAVSQHAVAAWAHSTSSCSTPGASCFALFAMDSTCSQDGVTMGGGNETLNGQVYSNSSDSFSGGTDIFNGAVTYGAGSGCTAPPANSSIHYNGGLNGTGNDPNWPIDYRTTFGSCSGSACTGLGNTPAYCGQNAAANFYLTNLSAAGVYCAYGTGTPSDPATWNGTIAVTGGGGTASSPLSLTLIGGNVTFGGGNYFLKSYSDNLLIYATTGATTLTGGNDAWAGDMFDPNGLATLSGGNQNQTTLVEANQINIQGGNFTGDGPTVVNGGSSTLGSDSLAG